MNSRVGLHWSDEVLVDASGESCSRLVLTTSSESVQITAPSRWECLEMAREVIWALDPGLERTLLTADLLREENRLWN